jgi:YihY family inner membrane protein
MAWTTSDRVMQWRERSHAFDLFAETMDGWRLHLAGRNASLLAFFSFLSIFPLMLAAVTILGFVLEGNEDLQQKIVDSAASEIPVLGQSLADDPEAINGSIIALVVGLGGALWSGTKAFVGLESALDDSWEVPVDDRDGLPVQRAKALLGVAIIAASQIGSLVIAGMVNAAGFPAISNAALVLATVAINIAVIATMYRFLTSYHARWSDVWVGAVIAGVVFTVLQNFGTAIVKQLAGDSNQAQGTINSILALITWLGLIGITVIMCAELNAARKRLREGPSLRGADLDIAIRT